MSIETKLFYRSLDKDQILHRLASGRLHIAEVQRALDRAKEQDAVLREVLQEKMAREGVRTIEGYGTQVVLQRRDRFTIEDEATIRRHLIGLGILDQYLRLDVAPVKKHAIAHGWPGVTRETVDTLVVRELKEGPVEEADQGA